MSQSQVQFLEDQGWASGWEETNMLGYIMKTLLTYQKCRAWLSSLKRGWGHKLMICLWWHNIIWSTNIHMLFGPCFTSATGSSSRCTFEPGKHDWLIQMHGDYDNMNLSLWSLSWDYQYKVCWLPLETHIPQSLNVEKPSVTYIASRISHNYKCTMCPPCI